MTPEERKEHTEKLLAEKGILVNQSIPALKDASEIKLKTLDDVCKRAIAALISTQLGIVTDEKDSDQAVFFISLIDHFGVRNCLNHLEEKIIGGTADEQDCLNVVWEYESCWSLFWALGLIDDISDASGICDCEKAIGLVSQCEDYEDFKSRCSLRSTDEILDMLDLYYRYHWATIEHKHIPFKSAGDLDEDVVYERRRGLEWLVRDVDDWYDIPLE